MTPHLHVGALDALVTFAYVLILSFFWRVLSARYSDRTIGQAMAVVL